MFEKGNDLSTGRPTGSKNKAPAEIRDMIRGALDAVGGVDYLKKQALTNPGPFLALIGKVIPQELKIEFKNPLMKLDAEDVIRLIQSLGRSRGFAVPTTIDRILTQETRALQTIPETKTIP